MYVYLCMCAYKQICIDIDTSGGVSTCHIDHRMDEIEVLVGSSVGLWLCINDAQHS